MGYRSSWALVVHCRDNLQDLADFEVWLELKEVEEKNSIKDPTQFDTFMFIRSCKQNDTSHPEEEGFLSYKDNHTKCYPPWDEVIATIGEYCDDHNLEWSYARVGEERTDIEEKGRSDYAYVCVHVSLAFDF